jgi:hypothetical protein
MARGDERVSIEMRPSLLRILDGVRRGSRELVVRHARGARTTLVHRTRRRRVGIDRRSRRNTEDVRLVHLQDLRARSRRLPASMGARRVPRGRRRDRSDDDHARLRSRAATSTIGCVLDQCASRAPRWRSRVAGSRSRWSDESASGASTSRSRRGCSRSRSRIASSGVGSAPRRLRGQRWGSAVESPASASWMMDIRVKISMVIARATSLATIDPAAIFRAHDVTGTDRGSLSRFCVLEGNRARLADEGAVAVAAGPRTRSLERPTRVRGLCL